jgi:hypothetical protein
MGLFDFLKGPSPETRALQAASAQRQAEVVEYLQSGNLPAAIKERLEGSRNGTLPWIATLRPAELLIARSHGLRPIATVSATCWLHYGWSWTEGHAQGWTAALDRLRDEARAAGANAVLDVKMRTVKLSVESSMDFTLVGTAVYVDGLPPSNDPIVATVPALEFVKLLQADVVPTGIAIGAHYEWMSDWRQNPERLRMFNMEAGPLSDLWELVRQRAHQNLRSHARTQGNGVLAHLNFSQMFDSEQGAYTKFLARHIVIATTVDARRGVPFSHDVKFVVDVHADGTPLRGRARHHQSYASSETEGAI